MLIVVQVGKKGKHQRLSREDNLPTPTRIEVDVVRQLGGQNC